MIEAILWDNDGVLVDTEILFFNTTKIAFSHLGLNLTEEIWAVEYLGKGKTSREIALNMGVNPDQISQVFEKRNQEYRNILQQPILLRPKVRETFQLLPDSIKKALVTGSHHDQLALIHGSNGLLESFDFILTGDDYTFSKPHPEPYLMTITALDLNSGNCIAVEDSQRGLASALTAGVSCIVVPTDLTKNQDFTGALSVEDDVSGVLKFIE